MKFQKVVKKIEDCKNEGYRLVWCDEFLDLLSSIVYAKILVEINKVNIKIS